jgi:hypothetical protein
LFGPEEGGAELVRGLTGWRGQVPTKNADNGACFGSQKVLTYYYLGISLKEVPTTADSVSAVKSEVFRA